MSKHPGKEKQATPNQEAAAQAEATAPETAAAQAAEGAQPEDAAAQAQREQEQQTAMLKTLLEQTMRSLDASDKERKRLQNENDAYKERLQRIADEYDNFRRRTQAEKEQILADAVCKAVGALLPALDSLERAAQLEDTGSADAFKKGVEMTLAQMKKGFEKLGVEEIDAQGDFNPDLHNAVMHIEDASLGENAVAEVFEKGYRIGDRVVRHATVKVAN